MSSSANPSNPAALARGQRRPFGPSPVPHGDFEGMEESTLGGGPGQATVGRSVGLFSALARPRGDGAGGGESVFSPSLSEPGAAPTWAQGKLFSLLPVRRDRFLAVHSQLVAYGFFLVFVFWEFFYVSYIAYQFWKLC